MVKNIVNHRLLTLTKLETIFSVQVVRFLSNFHGFSNKTQGIVSGFGIDSTLVKENTMFCLVRMLNEGHIYQYDCGLCQQ